VATMARDPKEAINAVLGHYDLLGAHGVSVQARELGRGAVIKAQGSVPPAVAGG